MPFTHRRQAGHELGISILKRHPEWRDSDDLIVTGLPRGGVPVAYEVAHWLEVPLRLLVVRKIGVPDNPELAAGAIADSDIIWWNEPLLRSLGTPQSQLQTALRHERKELARRTALLAPASDRSAFNDKTVILVDDGIATGATLRAALLSAAEAGAAHLVIAAPVAARGSLEAILREFGKRLPIEEAIVLETPDDFGSVGEWYEDFPQLKDEDVLALIRPSESPRVASLHGSIQLGPPAGGELRYHLEWPDHPKTLVIFAHGSLSSSQSPRNVKVAHALQQAGHATFLFDLLTEDEMAHRTHVFDIPFLAQRLVLAATEARRLLDRHLPAAGSSPPLVFYGASTGAAAAIDAAARLEAQTLAVISRGGRPDLADPKSLKSGTTPVILFVGSLDREVLQLNREAIDRMKGRGTHELHVIDGATHLFEEVGTLEQVAEQSLQFLNAALDRKLKAAA